VLRRIADGSLDPGTMGLMAGLYPLLALMLLFLLAGVLVGLLAVFRLELRYLGIIERLDEGARPGEHDRPAGRPPGA
jgi:hypothetical protein